MRKSIKRAGFVGVSVLAASSVGIAFAAWTAGGSGSGTAKAVGAELLTTTVATATADLYPGKTDGGLRITIDNPNDYAVTVTNIKGNGAVTSDDSTCTTTGVSLNGGVAGLTVSIVVEPNSNSTVTVPDAVSMTNDSVNGCQGDVFTIPVTLAGASS